MLSVKDNGVGIPKEHIEIMFEPFFTTSEGSGLGLSIVYSIVKNCMGFIKVHSEINKGTEFEVYIPRL